MNEPKKKRGRPKKIKPIEVLPVISSQAKPDTVYQGLAESVEELTPEIEQEPDVESVLDFLPEEDLVSLYQEAVERIKDGMRGFRELLPFKKPKLLRGESEWEVDTPDGKVYVYRRLPDVTLLKLIVEQAKGKAGTKETAVKATTLVLKTAVPGHDSEIDDYLRSLDPHTLEKHGLDQETLDRLKNQSQHQKT